jgi:hypothetical protein
MTFLTEAVTSATLSASATRGICCHGESGGEQDGRSR